MNKKNIEQLEKELHEIETQLKDLKARWPAHSLKPAMLSQLEELEEERDSLMQLLEEQGTLFITNSKSTIDICGFYAQL